MIQLHCSLLSKILSLIISVILLYYTKTLKSYVNNSRLRHWLHKTHETKKKGNRAVSYCLQHSFQPFLWKWALIYANQTQFRCRNTGFRGLSRYHPKRSGLEADNWQAISQKTKPFWYFGWHMRHFHGNIARLNLSTVIPLLSFLWFGQNENDDEY